MAASARRPGRVLAVVVLLALAGAGLAVTQLRPSAATSTLAGHGSDEYEATQEYHRRFGDDAVAVLVRGPLSQLLLTKDLDSLLGLEGCLSGNKPPGATAPGGPGSPCGRLAATKPAKVVYGPATFINQAVEEISGRYRAQMQAKTREAEQQAAAARTLALSKGFSRARADQFAEKARQLVYAEFLRRILRLNLSYGLDLSSLPSLNDPDFVSALVFDPSRGATTPKARFAYLFPSKDSALIQVRLKPGLDDEARAEAIRLVRAAVAMPQWRLDHGAFTVTGAPVVARDLTSVLSASTLRLLVVGVVVMALVLLLAFRARLRLVPLGVALGAVAIAFGLLALIGAPLTMAAIAVLPVLLGLGVDYAIQYQARCEDERSGDEREARGRDGRAALPTIATAAAATCAGFVVLLLSPVPMVQGFGVLLILGVGLAFGLALSAGTAALAVADRRRGHPGVAASSLRGAGEIVDAVSRGAGRALAPAGRVAGRAGGGVLRAATRHPRRVLATGLLLAIAGWAVDSRTAVVSDLQRLVPQDLPAVHDLGVLQRATGVAGEVDVVVDGADLTDPEVVRWMRDYQAAVLEANGWSPARGCGAADLCPAFSLPDLFRSQASLTRDGIRGLLDAVPPYFSQAVITPDRRTANLAFGIRLMPLDRQQEIVDGMRDRLHPPPGVRARLAGVQVLTAQANAKLSDPLRRLGTLLAGLLAVGAVLLAVYRRPERAWVPLAPIALASGWSALVLWALGIPLNPMSATLGALVIAISTEFAVLLAARFWQERPAAPSALAALRRTYATTGVTVAVSGTTAIAGFALLALSDVRMLRDFGLVTVVDLTVSLLGVLAVLPAVLMIAERRAAAAGAAADAEARTGGRERVPPAVPA